MTVQNEIFIVVGKERVVARSGGGAVGNGITQMDQLRLATIKVFEELLLDDTIQSRRHMEVLGQHLYVGIINNDNRIPGPGVDQLLNQKLNEVKKDRLRVLLQFDRDVDPEIAALPWEFLYSPTRQDFLATDVNLVLSRYMELGQDREVLSASERPLRTLVVISRPQDERAVLSNQVVDAIRDLNKGQEEIVSLRVVDPPTLNNIEAELKDFQPHIFHFIGHGKYDIGRRSGYLLLVNPATNNSDPCDDSTLIDCFKRAQCFPRLVFLHMCEGGFVQKDATTLQAFSGFAPKLIHARIASVVAMQYPIKNPDARDFSLAFYSTLAAGGSVDEAVQDGRSRLDLYRRSRLFGTPVLYMHSADGLVLPKPQTKKDNPPSQPGASGETATVTPPAPGSASKAEPMDSAAFNKVINSAITSATAIQDPGIRIAITQRLLTMKRDLTGKTRTDIFNAFFLEWDKATDQETKQVLETILPVI